MKKKIIYSVMALLLTLSMSMTAFAEDFTGGDNWSVYFSEDKKMVSTFGKNEFDDAIYQLQPGDSVTISLKLENRYNESTNWYMTNEVLNSLEDTKNVQAMGGAYSYLLYYTDASGKQTTLFDSDTVGGETTVDNKQGLNQATNSLEDWFFLETLKSGQTSSITLKVTLDGETQGNAYQNTLADLMMNFAVEIADQTTPETSESKTPETTKTPTTSTDKPRTYTSRPKTGDQFPILVFSIVAMVSGIVCVILVIFRLRRREDDDERAARSQSGGRK